MRPATRQSARLAINTVRQARVSRRRNPQYRRAFHTSIPRSSEPRAPNGHPNEHKAFSDVRESQKQSEDVESKEAESEHISKDEQESKVTVGRKAPLKRTLRQRRLSEVPEPPPIPEWFLHHNVTLVKGDREWDYFHSRKTSLLRCVDRETGHTIFTVPSYDITSSRSKAKEQSDGKNTESSSSASDNPGPASSKSELKSDFFDSQYYAVGRPMGNDLPSLMDSLDGHHLIHDYARWPLLEVETSVRAALSLPNADNRSSSFIMDRVDVSLICPDPQSHDKMDDFLADVARIVQADVIKLDANDLAELTGEYVGQGRDEPGSFSALAYDVFDGYESTSLQASGGAAHRRRDDGTNEQDEEDEEVDEESNEHADNVPHGFGGLSDLKALREALQGKVLNGRLVGIGIGVPTAESSSNANRTVKSSGTSSLVPEISRDDARLDALFEKLLRAPEEKRTSSQSSPITSKRHHYSWREIYEASKENDGGEKSSGEDKKRESDRLRRTPTVWAGQAAEMLARYLAVSTKLQQAAGKTPAFKMTLESPDSPPSSNSDSKEVARTIVHVRDLRDIWHSPTGSIILKRLIKVVRKRRRAGQEIVIVGTTSQDVPGPYRIPGEHPDDFPFRAITVPPIFDPVVAIDLQPTSSLTKRKLTAVGIPDSGYMRILEINFRNIKSMLRRLNPNNQASLHTSDRFDPRTISLPGLQFLTERILSQDEVQRLVLIAIGTSQLHAKADVVDQIHLAFAAFAMTGSHEALNAWSAHQDVEAAKRSKSPPQGQSTEGAVDAKNASDRLDQLKKTCNQHESRLLTGVKDAQNIKVGYSDVHAPIDTIEALKTLTSLSLLRPDAFKYGVLANDRLPGLLLYGPPGTGKTLLAKAVAKESKATVLEVTGAQIYEKYVGEGEKMVRAVFSLAKKLSPCVIFLDEADALFGSRSNAGNRNTHREIINQFLREWDGMDDHGIFMMVATNRPFDLDDAVLRRLPRRLLVDLPVHQDRESILKIHLQNETLDPSVSIQKLAEQTPLYSGSDLKNLSVAAALACVREENDLANVNKDNKDFKLPEKRVLTQAHFDKALAEISASISEDMTTLRAIRKFDEQYGDRRGRKKKTGYGFGTMDAAFDENAARVRQNSSSSPPPP